MVALLKIVTRFPMVKIESYRAVNKQYPNATCQLTHSRLTPSFWKCSQGLEGKIPIIDEKAKVPCIILVQKVFQNVNGN